MEWVRREEGDDGQGSDGNGDLKHVPPNDGLAGCRRRRRRRFWQRWYVDFRHDVNQIEIIMGGL